MRKSLYSRHRRFSFLFAVSGLFLMPASLFAQHTYYISKSTGLDSNTPTQAQAKSTPWAHLPGMPSCTANCKSYNPVAGDRFILKGGDTWTGSDLGVNWSWHGTSSARIYIGVDGTWFTGSSWTRPIFNCQNAACSSSVVGQQIWITGSYVTVDNIEFTGLRQTNGSTQNIATYSDHTEVENCYIHGWSRSAGQNDNGSSFAITANVSNGVSQVAGASFHDNVIDGSDTTKDMWNGIEFADQAYDNVIRYVVSGLLADFNDVHGNLIEDNVQSYAGDHCNQMFVFAPLSGSTVWAYNNVVRNGGCSGGEVFWINGEIGSACPNCASYIYNNVVYNSGRGIDLGSHPNEGNTGTYNLYNNTVEAGGVACMGNGEASPRSTTRYANNQCINGTLCDSTGTTCVNLGTNITQTLAQANAAGYSSSETYAYFPSIATALSVGQGQNLGSYCSGNLTALCSDTTYPTYDAVNHKVVMKTAVARPTNGAWDIGAYQFMTTLGTGGTITPPNSLAAAVH